jgi:hypothetical protein
MNFKYKVIYPALILLASCSPKNGLMVTKDKDGSKMLVGTSDKSTLMNDKAFGWFRKGYDNYKPDALSVKTISRMAASLHIEAFGGTWCSDTHELLRGLYKAMDAAKVPDGQITLHLVNRDKKTKDGSSAKYQIANVPTFIVLIGDKQLGRVVENAKTSIEADIAAMLVDKD